jgi:peptide/nickel transport system ATP-binding protein
MQKLRIEAHGAGGAVTRIVDDADVELRRGEVLGVIGESGAGKSTIGLAAMGYARRGCGNVGGKILFDGRNLRTLPEGELRAMRGVRVAYIAQSAAAAFNPAKRLDDQVCEIALRHRMMGEAAARKRAVELYGKLDLPEPHRIGRRFPHQVSGASSSASCRRWR